MSPVSYTDPRKEIRRLLEFWGLKDAWLAVRSGESRANISNWLGGKKSPQDPAVWDQLIALIPKPELEEPMIPVGLPTAKIPYAGEVPAGNWGDPLESEDFCELDSKFVGPKRFCCRVVGYSCFPALQPADIVVWVADRNPPLGSIVLAQRSADNACTVKELAL